MCRIVNKKIDTLVVSFGGVGTTFLSEFIGRFRQTNCPYDRDGLKHLPYQPLSANRNLKVVYVYGDPVEAAVSLFRRKFHATQARKTSPHKWFNRPAIRHSMTLEQFAELRRDEFHFENHFDHWFANPLGYPQAFIAYDQIWDSAGRLLDFLEIPQTSLADFPQRKERATNLDSIDSTVLKRLEQTYQPLKARFAELDSPVIQNGISGGSRFLRGLGSRSVWNLPSETLYWTLKSVFSKMKSSPSTDSLEQ